MVDEPLIVEDWVKNNFLQLMIRVGMKSIQKIVSNVISAIIIIYWQMHNHESDLLKSRISHLIWNGSATDC